MGIVVDIIIVAILALTIYLGYKKGLVEVAVKICAFVIAIVATVILYKPFANIVINVTGIDETIENSIIESANKAINNNNENGVAKEIRNSATGEIIPEAARKIAVNIVTGGCAIILFLAVRIGLIFVTALANAIAKLPILKQFNKAGGIIYGALKGIIIVYAILLLINAYAQFKPQNIMSENIEKSYIGKIMYQNNIFNVFFE